MGKDIYKKGLFLLAIIVITIITILGYTIEKNKNTSLNPEEELEVQMVDTEADKTQDISTIFVDIDGAVKKPGIYQLKKGMRLVDAIDVAGGLSEDVNADYISKHVNQARILRDEEKIYLPKIGDEISSIEVSNTNNGDNSTNTGKININTASKSQLITLKGIGESYAQRIIDYRNSQKFSSIEDIKNIKGIGDKTFEQIKDYITVE